MKRNKSKKSNAANISTQCSVKYSRLPEACILLATGSIIPIVTYLPSMLDGLSHYDVQIFRMISYSCFLMVVIYVVVTCLDSYILSDKGIEIRWCGIYKDTLKWDDIPYICLVQARTDVTIIIYKKDADVIKVREVGPGKGEFPPDTKLSRKDVIEILGREHYIKVIQRYYGPLNYDCKTEIQGDGSSVCPK